MLVTNKKILQNWIFIVIIMILGFSFIGLFILLSGNALTKSATESFYNYNIEEKKEQSRIEVSNRLDEINFERSIILEDEKEILSSKIEHIRHHLLILIEEKNLTGSEAVTWAIGEFEKEISEDKNYLYFIMEPEGTMLRSGTDKDIVGVNLLNSIDSAGNYFVKDIVKAKDNANGVFVDYYWPKVKGGEPIKKTSYCLYIPEFDFIIGTGIYLDDVMRQLKSKIYNRLQTYYENKSNYVFVTEYDSTARVSSNPDLLGQKMINITSFNGTSIHQNFMDVLKDADDGYASYKFAKKNSVLLTEKITYVHKLNDWNAYIGTGFYVDDLQDEVRNYSAIFKKHYYYETLYIILGLIILSIVVFVIFRRGAYMQKKILKQRDIIYKKLFELSNDAIVVLSDKNILLYENDIASKLFYNDTARQIDTKLKNFAVVDSNIYLYINKNDRKHYISIRKELVSYSGSGSTIFFINDITKQYLESNALEKMAYYDDLTSLQNRRALKDFYEDIYNEIGEDNTYILGMLDLDKFKDVNDTYGHNIGDIVLKKLAETFKTRLRQKDSLFRYGGEEFILLLNNISLKNSKMLVERLNKSFCESVQAELDFNCTFSCGLIMVNEKNKKEESGELIELADELLYKAKKNGRNRVEI
ncbi:MAG: cache domain-containing protein [Spirochaetaceae bacterium]